MAIEFKRLTNGTVTIKDTVAGKTKRKVDKGGVKNIYLDLLGNVIFANEQNFTLFSYPLADISTIDNVAAPSDPDDKLNTLSELFNNIPVTVSGGSGGGSIDTTGLAKDNTVSAINDKAQSIDAKTPALVGGKIPITSSQLPTNLNGGKLDVVIPDVSSLATSQNITDLSAKFPALVGGKLNVVTPDISGLAKSTDFSILATDAKLDALYDAINTLNDNVTAQATANGTSFDVVDAIEDLVPYLGGSSTTPTDYSTDTTLSALSAKLPATLGAKTGALSLSVVPNTDTNFKTAEVVSASSGAPNTYNKQNVASASVILQQTGVGPCSIFELELWCSVDCWVTLKNGSGTPANANKAAGDKSYRLKADTPRSFTFPKGKRFQSGVGYVVSQNFDDSDNTAITGNFRINFDYAS